MPNWCQTEYVVVGEEARKLYDIMNKLENTEETSGFGNSWIGYVIQAFGEDRNQIPCRGSFSGLSINELELGHVSVSFEITSAWVELSEFREMLEEKLMNTKILYFTEGDGEYWTNDASGEYFSTRYVTSSTEGYNYFANESELVEEVASITGERPENLEECEEIIKAYNEMLPDEYFSIIKVDIEE